MGTEIAARKHLKFTSIKAIIVSMLIIAGIYILNTGMMDFTEQGTIAYLSDEWNLSSENTFLNNITTDEIDDYIRNKAKPGDKVTITSRMPDEGQNTAPTIKLHVVNLPYKVYYNNNLITDDSMRYVKKNIYLGERTTYVGLPSSAAGRDVSIAFFIRENNHNSRLFTPIWGNSEDLFFRFISDNVFAISIGIFLFVFGILFFTISLFILPAMRKVSELIYSSLLCVNIGLYILSDASILKMFLDTELCDALYVVSVFTYVPLICLLLHAIYPYKIKSALGITAIIAAVSNGILILLHFCGVLFIDQTFGLTYIIEVALIVVQIITINREGLISWRSETAGSLELKAIIVLEALDMIEPIPEILSYAYVDVNVTIKLIGPAIFAALTAYNNLTYLSDAYVNGTAYTKLKRLAYRDELTGLANRATFDKLMNKFAKTDEDYLIMSIDLNDLKKINDNYGHVRGDEYIKKFGKILDETFSAYGTCARTGGDEFVVMSTMLSDEKAYSLSESLRQKMSTLSRKNDKPYSVAIGWAFRHERGYNDPHEIYLLADNRMYDNKRMIKGGEAR